jgi:hypothetical protein
MFNLQSDFFLFKGGDLSGFPSKDCAPLQSRSIFDGDYPVVPCGAIANSMFNDSFNIKSQFRDGGFISLKRTGIAWSSDREVRFRNPWTESGTVEQLKNGRFFYRI